MRCEARAGDVWLLAAGALAEPEARDLARHAQHCARCSRSLREARAFLAGGPGDVAPLAPPPELRDRLIKRVRESVAQPAPMRVTRYGSLAAAALVAALCSGLLVAELARRNFAPVEDALRGELALVSARHEDQRRELERLEQRLVELESQQAFGIAAYAPVLREEPVIGPGSERALAWKAFLEWTQETEQMGAAERLATGARVFCLESEGLCVLRAAGLPRPRPGEHYALWLTNVVGSYHLVGTFEVDANGEASLLASAPVDLRDVARSVVTLEPGEAGWRPEGSVVLVDATDMN